MKTYELKIQKKFYDLITSGVKKYEIRKMNKSNIAKGDLIKFIDLDTKEVLGYVKVKSKWLANPKTMQQMDVDDDTFKFVKENYLDESIIIIFEIKNVKGECE